MINDRGQFSAGRKAVIPVATGEVWVTSQKVILRSDGIGSCVVVAAHDRKRMIGGLGHIMLPGQSENRGFMPNRKYARDAIDDLLFKMKRLGSVAEDITACLIGGGNVLKDNNDTLCRALIDSVTEILGREGIRIMETAVGGEIRRSAWLNIEDGSVYCAEGDHPEKVLYQGGRDNE